MVLFMHSEVKFFHFIPIVVRMLSQLGVDKDLDLAVSSLPDTVASAGGDPCEFVKLFPEGGPDFMERHLVVGTVEQIGQELVVVSSVEGLVALFFGCGSELSIDVWKKVVKDEGPFLSAPLVVHKKTKVPVRS